MASEQGRPTTLTDPPIVHPKAIGRFWATEQESIAAALAHFHLCENTFAKAYENASALEHLFTHKVSWKQFVLNSCIAHSLHKRFVACNTMVLPAACQYLAHYLKELVCAMSSAEHKNHTFFAELEKRQAQALLNLVACDGACGETPRLGTRGAVGRSQKQTSGP